MVVLAALESSEAREYGWEIAPRSMVIPAWERRGREESIPKRRTFFGCHATRSVCPQEPLLTA